MDSYQRWRRKWGGGSEGPITFSIQNHDGLITEYTIPYQMTWQEFVDSEYNEIWYENKYGKYYDFEIYNGYVYVKPSDKIKGNGQYYAD